MQSILSIVLFLVIAVGVAWWGTQKAVAPEQISVELTEEPLASEVAEATPVDKARTVKEILESRTSVRLDLSNKGLTEVPAYVFDRDDVEELDVSNNNLDGALQAEVRHLQNLRVLNLSHNNFTGVPAEIGQLKNLEVLDLSHNALTGLPYELGNLLHLQSLNISGNVYSEADLLKITAQLPASTIIITE